MKLTENDIGKYFKRRDDTKSLFIGFDQFGAAVFEKIDHNSIFRVLVSGEHPFAPQCDIIAPWPETRTIKGWVNVYAPPMSAAVYPTKEEANSVADCLSGQRKCIACVQLPEITYTEGEGLSDDK